MKFYYDSEEKVFKKVKPFLGVPAGDLVKDKASLFRSQIHRELTEKNTVVFPLPSFGKLMKEQLTDPLNFFQIFSSALWLFDDNVLFPIFTIVILLFSNG